MPGLYQVIGYGGQPTGVGLPENYAGFFSPEGKQRARYSKIHLFGSEKYVFRPGHRLVVAPGPFGPGGLAICYDTMFMEVVRGLARSGARILYVPNYDPSAARGALHALHAAGTVFRAAENRVPLVRSETRGFSMIIDAKGRIVAEAGMGGPLVLVSEVTLPERPGALYTRVGDFFPFICVLLVALLVLWEMRTREKPVEDVARPEEESAPVLPVG